MLDWFEEHLDDVCDFCTVNPVEGAIVDKSDTNDPEYPEGLHIYHACEVCGMLFLDDYDVL